MPATPKPKLLTNTKRGLLFGRFTFRPDPIRENPERIKFLDDWKAKNLVKVSLGAIAASQGADEAWFHRDVAPHFEALVEAWAEAELAPLVLTWNGSFAARFKRRRAPEAGLQLEPCAGALAQARGLYRVVDGPPEKLGTVYNLLDALSSHSWGSAFDINARWNGLGARPAAEGALGSVRKLVPIAEKMGWAWGGRWKTPDGMHFEFSGVVK